MAETEEENQTLDQEQHQKSKRKPDLDCVEEGEADLKKKKLKNPSIPTDPSLPLEELQGNPELADDDEDDADFEADRKDSAEINGEEEIEAINAKPAVDKGKGKMVIEEEEEEEGEGDSDSDSDSSDSDDAGGFVGGDDESDFSDDPLAEVDLDNILPSRTRRRAPAEPGAYLVTDQDSDSDDDDDDEIK